MKEDGSIAIESDTSIDGKAPVVNIEADTEVNVTAPTINVIASTEVNVTAPTINAIADDIIVDADNATITASVKAVVDSPIVELGDGTIEKLLNKTGMGKYNGHRHTSSAIGFPTSLPDTLMVEDTDTTTDTKAS